MRPGAMDKLVSFEEDPATEEGSPVLVLADEPCAIESISAVERARGDVLHAEATHRLWLWYRPQITPAMRAVYQDPHAGRTRRFELLSAINVDEQGISLMCEVVERVT